MTHQPINNTPTPTRTATGRLATPSQGSPAVADDLAAGAGAMPINPGQSKAPTPIHTVSHSPASSPACSTITVARTDDRRHGGGSSLLRAWRRCGGAGVGLRRAVVGRWRGPRGLRQGPRHVRGQADGPGDVPDVRAGQGDGARAHARLLRGAEAGGGRQQDVHVRAGQGPRRAGARVQDQRHPRHGPALALQQPRHLLRLPKDSGDVARRPRGGDLQGVRQDARGQERHHHTCRCSRCRGDREEHERGADGGRRREAALHGLLLPRVGAARLRCGPAGLTGRPRQRSACMCIHGRPAGAAGDGDTTARTRRKSPETLKEMNKLKDTSTLFFFFL